MLSKDLIVIMLAEALCKNGPSNMRGRSVEDVAKEVQTSLDEAAANGDDMLTFLYEMMNTAYRSGIRVGVGAGWQAALDVFERYGALGWSAHQNDALTAAARASE